MEKCEFWEHKNYVLLYIFVYIYNKNFAEINWSIFNPNIKLYCTIGKGSALVTASVTIH